MKTRFILLILVSCFLLPCCSKKSRADKSITGIVGKWRLTEIYSGYVNGGNFAWNTVLPANSHTLQFSSNGQYLRTENTGEPNSRCTGTYKLLPGTSVEIHSSCQTSVQSLKISELTNSRLIIDHQGREGIIRYKYVPAN